MCPARITTAALAAGVDLIGEFVMTKSINEQPQRPGHEHRRLDVFVGKWNAEGLSYAKEQSKENPYGSAVKWTSVESYEWLPGGFFLVHRWDACVGDDEFKGMETIDYDTPSQTYFTRAFDNYGNSPIYQASVREGVWTCAGEWTRATVAVSDSGDTMTINWEWKPDGVNWLPLCDRKATKAM